MQIYICMKAHACILYRHTQAIKNNNTSIQKKHCQYMQTSMQKPKHAHTDKNIHAHTCMQAHTSFTVICTQTILVHIT